MSEPTEMAGVAEAETQAAYAWALDYEPTEMAGVAVDDLPTQPTQRLTSRHITALALAGEPGRDRGGRCGDARGAVT